MSAGRPLGVSAHPLPSLKRTLRTFCAHCALNLLAVPSPHPSPLGGGEGARSVHRSLGKGGRAGEREVHGKPPFRFFACMGTTNPPLTPPRRGTVRPRTNAGSPSRRGRVGRFIERGPALTIEYDRIGESETALSRTILCKGKHRTPPSISIP